MKASQVSNVGMWPQKTSERLLSVLILDGYSLQKYDKLLWNNVQVFGLLPEQLFSEQSPEAYNMAPQLEVKVQQLK